MSKLQESKPASPGYGDLFGKIDGLTGIEKRNFCRNLTLEEKKAYVNYIRDRDTQKVTGIFRCFEPAGGSLEMTAAAFDGEQPVKYQFSDGGEYTVPKYVAKRFESDFQGVGTWYPTHSHIMDQFGKPMVSVGKKNRRFGFSSMEFQ